METITNYLFCAKYLILLTSLYLDRQEGYVLQAFCGLSVITGKVTTRPSLHAK